MKSTQLLQIKIVKSSKQSYWYADRIGQVFLAKYGLFSEEFHYETVDPRGGYTAYVHKDDAEVVAPAGR